MKFLVVDDSNVFREAVRLLIEEGGHDAEGAASPEVAYELLREEKFDAIFLDLHLGKHSGLAVLPTLLELNPNRPVVVISAQGTIKNAVQAIQQGGLGF